MAAPHLAFDAVTCRRGDRLLFETLSFGLAAGQALVVTGPNGIGKSSLIRIAAGLLPAFAGTVERDGVIALLADHSVLDADRPLERALGYWAAIDGVPKARIGEALAALDLEGLADVPVRILSAGQRRRAGFARVVLSGAPIWLLDEPTTGLDAASVARFEMVSDAHLADGGLIALTTHQPIRLSHSTSIELGRL